MMQIQKMKEEQLPKLNLGTKISLVYGLTNPEYFRNVARPRLYDLCDNDAEKVHDLMLQTIQENSHLFRPLSLFLSHHTN